jgi:hypothetical protein
MDRDFEILYQPQCRRNSVVNEVDYYTEHVRTHFDDWAEMITESLETRVAKSPVLRTQNDLVQINVTLPVAFGVFTQPQLDPRLQLSGTFAISLPNCTH